MNWDSPKRSSSELSSVGSSSSGPGGGLMGEHRDRVLLEQAEALQRRQRDLLQQTSMQHPAEIRIRIWEQLHQMDLPRQPGHSLMKVIAMQTDLSLEQVDREQSRRAQVRELASAKV